MVLVGFFRRVLGAFCRVFTRTRRAAPPPVLPPSPITDREIRDRLQRVVERYRLVVLPRQGQMWDNNPGSLHHGAGVAGRYNTRTCVIELLPKYFLSPWVLAHEIGHHVATTERGDRSEEGADREGRKIVLDLLTDEEARLVMHRIDAYLPPSVQQTRRRP